MERFDKTSIDQKVNVLTLDGGGVRGLITIHILAHIEKQLAKGRQNYKISDDFHIIVGTSAGGLIALALAAGISAETLKEKMMEDIIQKTFSGKPDEMQFDKINISG